MLQNLWTSPNTLHACNHKLPTLHLERFWKRIISPALCQGSLRFSWWLCYHTPGDRRPRSGEESRPQTWAPARPRHKLGAQKCSRASPQLHACFPQASRGAHSRPGVGRAWSLPEPRQSEPVGPRRPVSRGASAPSRSPRLGPAPIAAPPGYPLAPPPGAGSETKAGGGERTAAAAAALRSALHSEPATSAAAAGMGGGGSGGPACG
ncbi:splicing factor, proline- and glutamine-rich-like [Microtus oregoni]|uniref:splicing factor, proline- and glutamine-rich-like n=1 Tax=Microtus oregoni TaxID=111838 RepID=UPI001BB0F3A3|nr:splicing factor, proline- and glutamine-rich-like [Microtus oregoni]